MNDAETKEFAQMVCGKMKTIELKKQADGSFAQEMEPRQATFKIPVRSKRRRINRPATSLEDKIAEAIVQGLEEIGTEALNSLTRGFFRR